MPRPAPRAVTPEHKSLVELELGFSRYLASFDSRRLPAYRFDVVVLGSGVAGSCAAMAAARAGCSVALVAKDELSHTNTQYAKGGVAAVLAPEDSFEEHVADTLRVGCGLCDAATVEAVVRGGPEAIERMVGWGAKFDCDPAGRLELSREGGHSRPRIVHAQGASTGLELQRTLADVVGRHPSIATFPRTFALDLVQDETGLRTLLCRTDRDEPVLFVAEQFVLATGGAGQLYRETTNPEIATGDGLAMGLRAGAALADLEFVQFHPTCLYIAGAARVLVSEIVRGAGGVLVDRNGAPFMAAFHPSADLAPRDVVSRACFRRMVETGDTSVYLDLSHLARDPHELFPALSRTCRTFHIDIARDPIPVRPGAHYWIGGLRVDLDGRTSVPRLWAAGECACSGLHGANRMGSNSLLEGLVLGTRAGSCAARAALEEPSRERTGKPLHERPAGPAEVALGIEDMTYSLKSLMWRQMGIEREASALQDALEKIRFWTHAVQALAPPEPRAWELVNMLTLARLATECALVRDESRGTHHRVDHPGTKDAWRAHTLVTPRLEGAVVAGVTIAREPVAQHQPVG